MMIKSPTHSNHESSHYDDYGFDDLQEDFSMFLEEAKQHGKEAKPSKSSSVHPEESRKTGQDKEKKKGKKSWKSSLVSWWKTNKKSKSSEEEHSNNNSQSNASNYGKRHGNVSGPICNSNKGSNGKKHWSSNSGPLTSLFKATKMKESEVPYMSLHRQNNPFDFKIYGPLYVVT